MVETQEWLVLGSSSKLGSSLIPYLRNAGLTVLSTSRNGENGDFAFDLVHETLEVPAPSSEGVAIVCLGLTRFQDCEDDPVGTYVVNVLLTEQLCHSLLHKGWRVIAFSSDAVLAGTNESTKDLETILCPTTEYGRQKLAFEEAMRELEGVNLIRLSKVVGANQDPWRTWLCELNEGKAVEAFSDYFLRPVHMSDVLKSILVISNEGQSGLWQVGGKTEVSYSDFLMDVANCLGTGGKVERTSGAGVAPVKRSVSMDFHRIEATGKWHAPQAQEVAANLVNEFRFELQGSARRHGDL